MGGHRFYTKSNTVEKIWHEILHDDFLTRPRLSRIFYQKKFFNYPPQIFNTLFGLGLFESIRILGSYFRWHIFPYHHPTTFEQWVTNAFGKRLFQTFFESYTEKVWGISCSELSAEWAQQRIRELSIKTILQKLVIKSKRHITTLIEEFKYPRLGPGMMWETAAEIVSNQGGEITLESDVVAILRKGLTVQSLNVRIGNESITANGDYFISSMPITELIKKMDPPPPENVLDAASKLKHRDFLTVCLIVDHPDLFPDNWIYIHEPEVKVARIQNYKNWSSDMVPDSSRTSLGLEYFCNQGDDLWLMDDFSLIALASKELEQIGLIKEGQVLDGCVHRVANAYPIYDSTYAENLKVVRDFCDQLINFRTVGRNGLHRYNNQDHSMLTALYATRMLVLGEEHDLWSINAEQEYLEEKSTPKH